VQSPGWVVGALDFGRVKVMVDILVKRGRWEIV